MEVANFFIYAFASIFVIVNPVAGMITFISLTSGMTAGERTATVKRSVSVACFLAIIFAISGELILRFFGVTLDCLRVAGGILLITVAMDMMQARVSRESVTKEEIRDATRRDDVSIFPIAIPLLTGPGTIATAIVIIRECETIELKVVVLLAILLTFIISYVIFISANKINKIIGVTGALVITRVMGLLLGAIAVNFISIGAWNIYTSMI
ncbi:MAG: NAAT family transporter [Methanosarcinales archaeon]|nr:MAG: NAAT family transporter [Methanosarcinales archaeon]